MVGFLQQLFLACFRYLWKSAPASASAALQATTIVPREGAQGLPEAAASLQSKPGKVVSQSIPSLG